MEPFIRHAGLVVPLDRENVDTDAIIPKQFMKSISRTGFGPNLFDEWRYLDHGEPGKPLEERTVNPDFVLNLPRYAGASVLLARKNFGCGSSREHAPWAIGQYGIRVIVAPAFGDIFFNNCCKNGLLPVVLTADEVERLFVETAAQPGYRLSVDLEAQTVSTPHGGVFTFSMGAFQRECMLEGSDDIGLTLKHTDRIRAFEEERLKNRPWL